jgi:glutamate/aspartate transport system ATP-binding protein
MIPELRSHIGMVFQNFELFPHMTVLENIGLGQTKVLGREPSEALARGTKLLERVGLTDQAGKHPAQLSGGAAAAGCHRHAFR